MIAGVNMSDCFWYQLTLDYPGLKGRKTVVVVVVVIDDACFCKFYQR